MASQPLKAVQPIERKPPVPCGPYLLIEVYITPERIGSILTPEVTKTEDRFSRLHGRVVAMGPDAYVGERFEKSGPWCKKGDWVIFARNEAFAYAYFGTVYAQVFDDRILAVIDEPHELKLITAGYKV